MNADSYPAHPECTETPGTLSCLWAAYAICQHCPWWTAVASPPEDREVDFDCCIWPVGWERTDAGWRYDADVAAEHEAHFREQQAEIDAENGWLRAAENPPPGPGDAEEEALIANDPWFILTDEEKQAQWDAFHKKFPDPEYDPAEDADSELSGGTGWPPQKEER